VLHIPATSRKPLAVLRRLFLALAWVALLLGTVSGAWFHGQMNNRWGAPALDLAASRIVQPLPDRFGNWRLVEETPFSEDVIEILQCPAYICRNYRNDQTGDTINVLVVVGRAGPISVHTPEICYSNADYQVVGDRTALNVRDHAQQEHSLWDVRLEANDVNATQLRVLYGWSTGGSWMASPRARFEFGGAPYLYKIQLAASATEEIEDVDIFRQFLELFLPELQQRLVSSSVPMKAAADSSSS
jgi:hypothetical protein